MSGNGEILIKVEGVSKKFCRSLRKSLVYGARDIVAEINPFASPDRSASAALRPDEFWAVQDVSFELRRGECLGLIGHNGAGKTTLLKMLNGLIKPDHGRITMRGRVGALIALGAGFNPILTGRENIYVNGSVLGLSKREIDGKIEEIIDFAGVRDFIDAPVQSYSSGMQVRLGFAVATAMEPDVLLLDEVLAVGDANFRSKCYQRIGSVLERCAVIFVSHEAYSIRRICNEVVWLKRGKQMYHGSTEEGMIRYSADDPQVEKLEPLTIVGDYIRNLTCKTSIEEHPGPRQEGSLDVHVRVEFEALRAAKLGISMLNFVAAGEQVIGQSLLEGSIADIQPGKNVWAFTLPDIRLARGVYSLTFAAFEHGNKLIAINIRNQFQFKVSRNPRYAVTYAPTVCIQKSDCPEADGT